MFKTENISDLPVVYSFWFGTPEGLAEARLFQKENEWRTT
jgi:hypothetical protein